MQYPCSVASEPVPMLSSSPPSLPQPASRPTTSTAAAPHAMTLRTSFRASLLRTRLSARALGPIRAPDHRATEAAEGGGRRAQGADGPSRDQAGPRRRSTIRCGRSGVGAAAWTTRRCTRIAGAASTSSSTSASGGRSPRSTAALRMWCRWVRRSRMYASSNAHAQLGVTGLLGRQRVHQRPVGTGERLLLRGQHLEQVGPHVPAVGQRDVRRTGGTAGRRRRSRPSSTTAGRWRPCRRRPGWRCPPRTCRRSPPR